MLPLPSSGPRAPQMSQNADAKELEVSQRCGLGCALMKWVGVRDLFLHISNREIGKLTQKAHDTLIHTTRYRLPLNFIERVSFEMVPAGC